jgi:2-C-methyl-D-erythritol 2,4-cyclodiphosphate synthase
VPPRPHHLRALTTPPDPGPDGHSDADAVCHALTDAIHGPAGAGDIGRQFPDTDAKWKGADSLALLARAAKIVAAAGFVVVNVDVVVIAQRPKLVPYLDAMRANLSRALAIVADDVSVKGKTNEGVDSMGAGESIAVHAVALVSRV